MGDGSFLGFRPGPVEAAAPGPSPPGSRGRVPSWAFARAPLRRAGEAGVAEVGAAVPSWAFARAPLKPVAIPDGGDRPVPFLPGLSPGLRISDHCEHQDRTIVNTRIGAS